MSNDRLSKQALGQKGEELARQYIIERGWALVTHNWRCEHGEIDIIAEDKATLVFIEVRTRRGQAALEKALVSVNLRKQARLAQLVDAYRIAEDISPEQQVRVDVIGVALDINGLFTIEWIQDALSW